MDLHRIICISVMAFIISASLKHQVRWIDTCGSPIILTFWLMGTSSLDLARHHQEEHSHGNGSVEETQTHGKHHVPVDCVIDCFEVVVDIFNQVLAGDFLQASIGDRAGTLVLGRSEAQGVGTSESPVNVGLHIVSRCGFVLHDLDFLWT